MTKIQEMFPIISVADMPKALAFYRDLLGGEVVYQFPAEGEPGYVGMKVGSSQLGIGLRQEPAPGQVDPERFTLWCYADDCDAAIDHLRANGIEVTAEPEDQPWGERMGSVCDPDGNKVIIASR
ncbi:MAG TPA: bleomycin resistance protein [Micromonosporaceae bacterium]|nr:bleomycin resistance protein [Micromonosporaceae bacterium]